MQVADNVVRRRQGRSDNARAALTNPKKIVSAEMPRIEDGQTFAVADDWHDWLHARILSREAEQTLAK
jgi:hypothetical protein